MSRRKRSLVPFWKTVTFWIAAFSTLVFLVIALLLENYWGWKLNDDGQQIFLKKETWLAVSKELFFASAIAMFVIMTVEQISKREQSDLVEAATNKFQNILNDRFAESEAETAKVLKKIEEASTAVSENVFNAIYKSNLPEEFSTEIEESVFRSFFVRTKHARSMTLKELPNFPEHLAVHSQQEFIVKNITGSDRMYNPNVIVPLPIEELREFVSVVRLNVGNLSNDIEVPLSYPFTSKTKKSREEIETMRTRVASGWEDHFQFPGVKIQSNCEVKIEVELVLVKDRSDNEIWTSLIPTLSGEISVTSEVEGLEIGAISLHRGGMIRAMDNNHMHVRWTLERPILPHQGYVVYWRPPVVSG